MREKNHLKMSLEEIRNSIDVTKDDWNHKHTTNCYAYALGLDIPEFLICKYAYDPGTIGNSNNPLITPFSYNNLIDNIILDLKALQIDYSFINTYDVIKEDEWKIALFIPPFKSIEELDDFHFLRYNKDNTWYHKYGTKGIITNLDYYDQLIKSPTTCDLQGYIYTDCLKLKRIK